MQVIVRLDVLDQWHLRMNHRDGRLLLQQTGDPFDLIPKALEGGFRAQQGHLEVEHEKIEPLRFFRLCIELGRQPGNSWDSSVTAPVLRCVRASGLAYVSTRRR